MTLKGKIESHVRGLFPQMLKTSFIESAENKSNPSRWDALPFSALGSLMIIASLISVAIGANIVQVCLSLFQDHGNMVLNTAFYVGILSIAAFAVGLYSGILLLTRKHIVRALTGILVILAFGLATLLIPLLEGLSAQSGLQVASPMIVSSIGAICMTMFKMGKQKTELTTQKEQPTSLQRTFTGLAAFGTGFTMVGSLFYFQPLFPKSAVVLSLAIGVLLLGAASFGIKKYKNEKRF
jgi:hypothetical protein